MTCGGRAGGGEYDEHKVEREGGRQATGTQRAHKEVSLGARGDAERRESALDELHDVLAVANDPHRVVRDLREGGALLGRLELRVVLLDLPLGRVDADVKQAVCGGEGERERERGRVREREKEKEERTLKGRVKYGEKGKTRKGKAAPKLYPGTVLAW